LDELTQEEAQMVSAAAEDDAQQYRKKYHIDTNILSQDIHADVALFTVSLRDYRSYTWTSATKRTSDYSVRANNRHF